MKIFLFALMTTSIESLTMPIDESMRQKNTAMIDPGDRSLASIRAEALWRIACLNSFASVNGSILVTEFPKSGGTWLSRMLSDVLDLKFPRHEFPGLKGSVFHGHYRRKFGRVPTIALWRDPRDIMISWYHHLLLSPKVNPSLRTKALVAMPFSDYENVQKNLPDFIRICFSAKRVGSRFTWNEYFDTYKGVLLKKNSVERSTLVFTSYEELRYDAAAELSRVVTCLGRAASQDTIESAVRNNSFKFLSGRAPGTVDNSSYLRKGVVGDWQNYFSNEAVEVLDECTEGRLASYLSK